MLKPLRNLTHLVNPRHRNWLTSPSCENKPGSTTMKSNSVGTSFINFLSSKSQAKNHSIRRWVQASTNAYNHYIYQCLLARANDCWDVHLVLARSLYLYQASNLNLFSPSFFSTASLSATSSSST